MVRKEKYVFEMHTPHRVYILQALDDLDLEEWLIRTNDWIDYFAQVDKQVDLALTHLKSNDPTFNLCSF